MNRWGVLLLLLVGCQSSGEGLSPGESDPPQVTRPNIVLVVADDLGYGDLGCYGQAVIQTPRLDRMAREGMRFTDFYAGSTVCAPSRCSLMTGLHTGHTRVRGNREVKPMGQLPLEPGDLTIAEVLQSEGYATGLFGKWGLGGPGSTGIPTRQGFDEFYGYLCQRHAHNYYPEFLFDGEERVPLRNRSRKRRADGAGVAVEKIDYASDLITERALDFIDRNAGEPFFLMVTTTIPHANNEARKEGMEVPDLGIYADRDWPEPQKGHAAMITRMDRDVGRLIDRLRHHGVADDTLVLFTSDNGPHREGGNDPHFHDSNGPFRGIKRSLHDGGIRVPLIAWWPDRVAAGTTSSHIAAFWDLLPTLAEIAGGPNPEGVDGISFAPTLLGTGEQPVHDHLYWEFHEGRASSQAVRQGQWKAVRKSPADPVELYDLSRDPGERDDLAASHPEEARRLTELIDGARVPSPIWKLRP